MIAGTREFVVTTRPSLFQSSTYDCLGAAVFDRLSRPSHYLGAHAWRTRRPNVWVDETTVALIRRQPIETVLVSHRSSRVRSLGDSVRQHDFAREDTHPYRRGALLARNEEFTTGLAAFHSLWPVFSAREIRSDQLGESPDARREKVEHYRANGISYEPRCFLAQLHRNEPVPMDWPHTLYATYRV
jgi:hypothetical protein